MRKRIVSWVVLMTLILSCFAGCKKENEDAGIKIYYMDALGNGLVTESHVLRAKSREKQAKEIMTLLASTPETSDYRRTIPEGVEVLDIVFDKKSVTINFDRNYEDFTGYTEVLIRAAVVKSLLQIDGVESVTFYVADKPLLDSKGILVGSMSGESFIEDYGEETDSLIKTTLTLYFASANGQSLVKKNVDVYYNNNIAKERLVLENLIKGVDDEDAKSAIPAGTKLLNVTVTDGVCYVNFDSTFLNVDSGISADVVVYSIVNSLTELDNINKVQLLVNGASSVTGNASMIKLGTSFERDTTKVMEAVEREILVEDGGQ
ncbi:MAG: GerMN domain-containing protein [Lachnospiraceae bacterium]|nr:GerMN domain-containing protein [Lachnospiraceae bacterium]